MTDELLLGIAGVTATVAGLFVVGVFYFADTATRRKAGGDRGAFWAYLRSSTRIVLLLFAMALGLPLALAAFDLVWARVLYVAMGAMLVAANVDTAIRVRATRLTGTRTLLVNEILGTVGVTAIVVLPWVPRGGRWPGREEIALSALLALATAVASVGAIALSAFDITDLDPADRPGTRGRRRGSARIPMRRTASRGHVRRQHRRSATAVRTDGFGGRDRG